MKQLVELSGLSRSLVHYYLREGILPKGHKSARNAATYSERHLDLAKAICRLRTPPLGPLPQPLLRRVIELIEQGVELEAAVALERAVFGAEIPEEGVGQRFSREDLARAAQLHPDQISELLAVGMLVPAPGEKEQFDIYDIQMARLCCGLLQTTGLPAEAARPISSAIRELSQYEMGLRNKVVEHLDPNEAAKATLAIQECANQIHQYQFYRWRLYDIAQLRRDEQLSIQQSNESRGES